MSWKSETLKAYEARVVADALARLAKQVDLKALPFSDDELRTLAKRAREFFTSENKRGRFDRFKAHLSARHGEEPVAAVAAALVVINNAIGYEEK